MILTELAAAVALSLLGGTALAAAIYGAAIGGARMIEHWRHPLPDRDDDRWFADDPNS